MITRLCIDPGPVESGWCKMRATEILEGGKLKNQILLHEVELFGRNPDAKLAIEMIASYGMPVGADVFQTCVWIGRFMQAWSNPDDVLLVTRKEIKLHICGTPRAKDANIRQAIIDKFPPRGDGKIPQIGTKTNPGPLYGVTKDEWAALALGFTVLETEGQNGI